MITYGRVLNLSNEKQLLQNDFSFIHMVNTVFTELISSLFWLTKLKANDN